MIAPPECCSHWAWRGGAEPYFTAPAPGPLGTASRQSLGGLSSVAWSSARMYRAPRQIHVIGTHLHPRTQQYNHPATPTQSWFFILSPASCLSPIPFLGLPAPHLVMLVSESSSRAHRWFGWNLQCHLWTWSVPSPSALGSEQLH